MSRGGAEHAGKIVKNEHCNWPSAVTAPPRDLVFQLSNFSELRWQCRSTALPTLRHRTKANTDLTETASQAHRQLSASIPRLFPRTPWLLCSCWSDNYLAPGDLQDDRDRVTPQACGTAMSRGGAEHAEIVKNEHCIGPPRSPPPRVTRFSNSLTFFGASLGTATAQRIGAH